MKKKIQDLCFFCDGFLNPEPKVREPGCSVGLVVDDKLLYKRKFFIKDIYQPNLKRFYKKECTVPEAEFFAIYNAFQIASRYKGKRKRIFVFSDAEVIVKLINGIYKPSKKRFKILIELCNKVRPEKVTLLWVSRVANVKWLGH